MSKKKTSPAPDLLIFSGAVRMFKGQNYSDPIEDMSLEHFPATSEANARAYLISAARAWLDESGYPNMGGVQILACEQDGQPAKKSSTGTVIQDAFKGNTKAPTQEAVRQVYKAFKCPISSLCRTRYTGRFDHVADTLLISQEK